MSEKTGKKQKKGRFKPGQSGNPKGRPKGALNKTTLAALELLNSETKAITRKAIDMALNGDMQALKLCLERIIPVRKESPVNAKIHIPKSIEDLPFITGKIIKLVSQGKILPSEGEKLSKLVENHIKAIEIINIEKRLSKLENLAEERYTK